MSYTTIAQCAGDFAFQQRMQAAAAAEHAQQRWGELVWPVAAKSDIAAAYASAVAADNPNPGGDESVITDQMILSAVQAEIPNLPTP